MDAPDSSTPRSTTTETPPLLKAAKDKTCPFCGQAFTSSSLGRHLDLYIRPKNPKPADGIHVVDEIRRLRGGITRRQAKSGVSLCTQDDGDSAAEDAAAPRAKTPARRRDGGKARRAPRHVTSTAQASEAAETARATEMALRELLQSVRAASAKACGAALFDFDPCTLSFPALCLHMLPPPPTLFSPTPFPSAESWSTTPPGQQQLDALNKLVRERLLRQRHVTRADASAPLPTPPLFDPDPQKLFCHMADAFSHWMRHSERTRQEYWQTEILRCYARADDRRRDAEAQLEQARREIDRLKANGGAAGAAAVSPITINLGTGPTTELGAHGIDFRNWDYDRLIDKWRAVVRQSKATHASGLAAQRPLPGPPASTAAVNQPRQASPVKVEGLPFTAPPTVVDEPGSDQIDAQGDDDDDEDVGLDQHTPPEDHSMNEHHPQPLRPRRQHQQHMPLQPTSLHHTHQAQAHMQNQMHVSQAQAQAQAQLHAQANAQAHAQAQAWAAARQHMNQSRNQNFSPHQHQQLSSHPQHISRMDSAASSRRPSVQLMDPHAINPSAVNPMQGGMTMATGMEGIQTHQDQFLGMDMGLTANFVGQNDQGLDMGS
ncbi:hypothetical protein BDU57DRAFT_542548 [Ampelomyces quisqualis]|uniref:Uncharacterized protein n=1 Tax=Ampelomyces quisqualis TaxID=50730 RepID=A0A6A5Q8B0_AMPQU|nr:hypothetical protein BDU57DRAFT_542548 [Ampelomyces quisqualis]